MHSLLAFQQLHERFVHTYRYSAKQAETYYDILQVSKNCDNKEIRQAFVQLSKKFHPDVKGIKVDAKQTAQFVKISEAYHTLSKPKLRNAYDQDLWAKGVLGTNSARSARSAMHPTEFHRPWEVKPNYDPNPGPYYGVKGLQRMSNSKIALSMIALGVFGAIFGFFSVKQSFSSNRAQLDERSAEASSYHASVRADAKKYGNEEQLRRMVSRMSREES